MPPQGWPIPSCLHWQQHPPALPALADEVDDNIGAYCSLDEGGRRPIRELTTGQKEQLFLEAMAVRRRSSLPGRAGCSALEVPNPEHTIPSTWAAKQSPQQSEEAVCRRSLAATLLPLFPISGMLFAPAVILL